jgi:membrane-associated phospholipid phosphatase
MWPGEGTECYLRTVSLSALGLALLLAEPRVAPSLASDRPEEPPPAVSASPAPSASPVAAGPAATEPVRPKPWVADDKRRTMRSYWANLRYNFMGVVTPGNYAPLLVTTALTAPAIAGDHEFKAYFQKHPHVQFGNIGANMGGGIAVAGLTLGFFSAGRYAHGDRFRATTYDVSQAVIVNGVYVQVLKFIFRRERPDGSNRQSFPSGHASNAFAGATAIVRHYPRLAVPAYGVATYIAVSRMAANKHYFSDVVAGAGFGFGVGRLVDRRNGRPPDKPGAKDTTRFEIVPDAGPAGDGRGLALAVHF